MALGRMMQMADQELWRQNVCPDCGAGIPLHHLHYCEKRRAIMQPDLAPKPGEFFRIEGCHWPDTARYAIGRHWVERPMYVQEESEPRDGGTTSSQSRSRERLPPSSLGQDFTNLDPRLGCKDYEA